MVLMRELSTINERDENKYSTWTAKWNAVSCQYSVSLSLVYFGIYTVT